MTEIKTTKIPRRQKCVDKDHPYIGGSVDIIDDSKNKTQEQINSDVDDKFTQLDNKIEALEKQDVIPVDTLPGVADADPKKIYRVVGEDSYTDYMVNASGDGWKTLATYSFPGIDDKPTAESNNLVKSSGVYKHLPRKIESIEWTDSIKGCFKKNGTFNGSLNRYYWLFPITENGNYFASSTTCGMGDTYCQIILLDSSKNFISGLLMSEVQNDDAIDNFLLNISNSSVAFVGIGINYGNGVASLKTSEIDVEFYQRINKGIVFKNSDKLPKDVEIDNYLTKEYYQDNIIDNGNYKELQELPERIKGIATTQNTIDSSYNRYIALYDVTDLNNILISTTTLGLADVDYWYGISYFDSSKNVIGGITCHDLITEETQSVTDYPIDVTSISNCKYIGIAVGYGQGTPTAKTRIYTRLALLSDIKQNEERNILWLGTSIPEWGGNYTKAYPNRACKALGYNCYNQALGSSFIKEGNGEYVDNDSMGKSLSETTAEKIAKYQQYIGQTYMSQERYNTMVANWGYEKQILPYIDGTIANCDTIVFDHGYNDRNLQEFTNAISNFDSLDLSIDKADAQFDRGTFVGAFCYLLKQIYNVNPNIKVVICSYLENKTGSPEFPTDSYGKCGYVICSLQKKIAEHFNFPFIPLYEQIGFGLEFIAGTQNYISDINTEYGTSYEVRSYAGKQTPNNYVSRFQFYCPDGTHPHTDRSWRSSDAITNAVMHYRI